MNEQRLLDELRARAADDARAFRDKFPNDAPNERWIENSYTAALPLAKDRSGFDPGTGPHPHLFSAYADEVRNVLGRDAGGESNEASRFSGSDQVQQPTRGEG